MVYVNTPIMKLSILFILVYLGLIGADYQTLFTDEIWFSVHSSVRLLSCYL